MNLFEFNMYFYNYSVTLGFYRITQTPQIEKTGEHNVIREIG